MGDMFQGRIGKIFKELSNVFGIAEVILVVGYDQDGADLDTTLSRVLNICRKKT